MKKPGASRVHHDALPKSAATSATPPSGGRIRSSVSMTPRCTAAVMRRTFAAGARRATGVLDV
jgi:hypothetical protein